MKIYIISSDLEESQCDWKIENLNFTSAHSIQRNLKTLLIFVGNFSSLFRVVIKFFKHKYTISFCVF